MERSLIVLHKTSQKSGDLIERIKFHGFKPLHATSLKALEGMLNIETPIAVLIDTDSIPLDNRSFQRFHKMMPDTHLLLISSKKTHPELEESIGKYVYACISKPVDPDELNFWMKSILDDLS